MLSRKKERKAKGWLDHRERRFHFSRPALPTSVKLEPKKTWFHTHETGRRYGTTSSPQKANSIQFEKCAVERDASRLGEVVAPIDQIKSDSSPILPGAKSKARVQTTFAFLAHYVLSDYVCSLASRCERLLGGGVEALVPFGQVLVPAVTYRRTSVPERSRNKRTTASCLAQ